jgi:ABC-2 type transport system ATP-binding protein
VSTTHSATRPAELEREPAVPVIEVRGLRKRYGSVEAVRGVDLTVGAGEIVAFLGPNGAGRTTTLEILAGHRQRDAGEVSALGFDPGGAPRAFRERIGIVPQETAIEPVLTVAETVRLCSAA